MLLTLQVTARAPLAFAERKPGRQFRSSMPYVPGATLYGALGEWFGARGAFDAGLFERLRCHNAYPAHEGDAWVRPLPATAVQSKGEEDRAPQDALAPLVCWERQRPAALVYAPVDSNGRPLESCKWRFYTLENENPAKREVYQRVLTRVAINRRRGTAEDQRLYSPLALSEVTRDQPTQFRGSIVVPDGDERASDALSEITHLGGRQSSGLGAVELCASSASDETAGTILDRVERLTERFRRQEELYAGLRGERWEIPERTIFTVNLLSDAILLEQGWLPTQELNAALLHEQTGIEATLVRSFAATAIVGGWNVSWQRPKPSALATTMGSLFVFQAARSLESGDCARLAALQLDGIGERRPEGYGQVRICDEFHLIA